MGAVTHARSMGGEKVEHRQGTGSGEHKVVEVALVGRSSKVSIKAPPFGFHPPLVSSPRPSFA